MKNIYCIGETVYDIIFKNGQPVASKAGGSMLNACISMGRMGLPAHFISEYGKDQIGEEINTFLHSCHVNTTYVYQYTEGKTSIAIAFLNEKNDATYSFYKHLPEKRLSIDLPDFKKDDLVLMGSFYAINEEIRPIIKKLIKKAKEAGAIIYYDPNFRKAHLFEIEKLKPMIFENMQMADIVRGSHEDFETIFGTKNKEEAYQYVRKYCDTFIYTEATQEVSLKTSKTSCSLPVKKIQPISTIGAGDNFNAGILYGLFYANIEKESLENISSDTWAKIISHGINFATEVCLSYDNYISQDFAHKYQNDHKH